MLKVAIMSIGNELMNGSTVDTNSSWLAKQISSFKSLTVTSKITVKDDSQSIKKSLHSLLEKKYKYIFITGGLGPTHDDITKETLSSYFKSKIIIKESYLDEMKIFFRKKNIKDFSHLKSQAEFLDISTPLPNKSGTALGMYIDKKKSKIFVLPGVPIEMKDMFENTILPLYIHPFYKQEINSFTFLTTGIYESKLHNILNKDIENNKKSFILSFLPNHTGVKIRIEKRNDDISKKELIVFKNKISQKIDKYIYGYDDENIEKNVANLLISKGITISVVESCTGGYLSKKLTNYPNSTKFYKGGIVAYNNQIKVNILNVPNKLILSSGSVSEDVAIKMAKEIKNKFKTNIGISITGISGPSGGSDEKPVGMVCISIVSDKSEIVKTFYLKTPNRAIHRAVSTHTALNMLRLLLVK